MTEIIEQFSNKIFSLICHQQSSLLLLKNNKQILLCPRCIGLEIGFCYTFGLSLIVPQHYRLFFTRGTIIFISFLILLMVFDFLRGWFDISIPTEFSRLITGSSCGTAFGMLADRYRKHFHTNSIPWKNLSEPTLILLTCAIMIFSMVTVFVSTWYILTTILLIAVLLNVLFVGNLFKIFISSRFLT